MYLIEKGRKPRAICRECRAIHKTEDCPRLEPLIPRTFPERVASVPEFMEFVRLAQQMNEERYAAKA